MRRIHTPQSTMITALAAFALALFVGAPAAFAQQEGQPAEDTTSPPPADIPPPVVDTPPAPDPTPPPPAAPAPLPADDPPEDDDNPSADDIFGDDDDDLGDDDGWNDETPEPTFPRLEHRGYFRFRADMFSNMHLGTNFRDQFGKTLGTSAFLPPVTENFANNSDQTQDRADVGESNDETFLASANMRFRYQPTFLISDSLKIAATFDVLDNLVLGSTPDFHFTRPDTPLNAFSGTQAPPGGDFQFQDSIRVKELYGEWKIFGAPLRFGRMKSDWGLGILANGGEDWDDDYGDYVDRVMIALQFYGIYVFGGYDIISSGPTYKQDYSPFGQAYDMTETDDVQQGFIGVFSRPLRDDEVAERRDALVKRREPVFDWGIYMVARTQTLDLSQSSHGDVSDGTATYDDLELVKREGWAIIPDIWLRFEYRPSFTQRVRLELEATMIYGKVERVVDDPTSKERELLQWGVAFEGDYTMGGLTIGLDAGAASGDDAEFLAVQDRSNFAAAGNSNTDVTNFKFDRNYRIDQILFSEVIGTVTNAWYAKPYVQYDLFDSPDGAIGGRLDILVAGALEKDAYPGNEMFLGTEFDAKIFIEDTNKFYADISFGLFLPGGAWDLIPGFNGYGQDQPRVEAELAWTLQTHLVIKY